MSELNDIAGEYSGNQAGMGGKPSLLDYYEEPLEEEVPEGGGQNPMLSHEDVSRIARKGSISAVESQQDPGVSGLVERDKQAISDVGIDPELIFEGNAEKFGKSLVYGTGIVVNDIGNMMDYASMTLLPDEVRKSDTFLSITERLPNFHQYGDALQKWGEVHQSPGLDEFTLDDMFKAEFWATSVAQTLPYIATMVIPGKLGIGAATKAMTWAARGAAKKGLFGSAKRLLKTRSTAATGRLAAAGGSEAAAGAAANMSGKGIMGALATSAVGSGEVALSSFGTGVATFLGTGTATTAVIGAGLSGDVYTRALEMGMTEEEAQSAAHGTFIDNSKWFALNGLSWMINFGGLSGKAFKYFNMSKGGAANAAVISKTFSQRVSQHMMKGVVTGTLEGTEEMFQETYEEWIQETNLAEARGEEFSSYSDFFQSKNNRKTLGVSFAAGFLMGGRAGLMNSIADNGRAIIQKRVSLDDDINMMEGMSDSQRRTRLNEVVEAAVREDQLDGLNGFLDKMASIGKITTEERAEYDKVVVEYAEIASTLPFQNELTEVGQQAVFNIKIRQNTLTKASANLESLKGKSIAEAKENLEGDALTSKLASIDAEHKINMINVEREMSESKTALSKIVSGKKYSSSNKTADQNRLKDISQYTSTEEYQKASETEQTEIMQEKVNLEARIKEDSYVIEDAAMSQGEFEQFTNKGVAEKTERAKVKAEAVVDKVEGAVKGAAVAGEKGFKGLWSKAKTVAGKTADFLKTKIKDSKESRAINKITRPLEGELKEMIDKGATASEVSNFIMKKVTPEQLKETGLTQDELELKVSGLSDTLTKAKKEDGDSESKEDEKDDSDKEATKEGESESEKDTSESAEAANSKAEVDEDVSTQANALQAVMDKLTGKSKEVADKFMTTINEVGSKLSKADLASVLKKAVKGLSLSTEKGQEAYIDKLKGFINDKVGSIKESVKAPTEDSDGSPKLDIEGKIKEAKTILESLMDEHKGGFFKVTKKVSGFVSKANAKLSKIWKSEAGNVNIRKKKSEGATENKKDDTISLLSYYATANPGVEAAIMEAASNKFPSQQLLILREVIDNHGQNVVGYAMGAAVLAKNDANLADTIMHEYGHVYFDIMKDNPSFMRGASKIVGSDVYKDVKKLYAEEVLYVYNGNIVKGGEIFDIVASNVDITTEFGKQVKETVEAMATAIMAGDLETYGSLNAGFMLDLQKTGVIEILPDADQKHIIEEAFVSSLAPRISTKLDVLFEKPAEVREYKSFLKRITGKVVDFVTPESAKKILSEVDRSFEELSMDEMYSRIADDFATGSNGANLNGIKKSKLHPTIASSISIALNKIPEADFNNMSAKEVANHIIEFAKKDQFFNKKGDKLDVSADVRAEVELRVAKEKERRAGFSLDITYNDNGVGSIYKAAKMQKSKLTKEEQNKEAQDRLAELDQMEGDVNILSDDVARMKSMDNSTTKFLRAILKIANPKGKRDVKYDRTNTQDSAEAKLWAMARSERNDTAGFIKRFNNSTDKNIVKIREIMNEHMSNTEVLAALSDMHNNYRNKSFERIRLNTIGSNGQLIESMAVSSSESKVQESITRRANEVFYEKKSDNPARRDLVRQIQAAKKSLDAGKKLSMRDALSMAVPIMHLSDQGSYLDLSKLTGAKVKVGNKILNIQDFMTKFVMDASSSKNEVYLKKGQVPIMFIQPLVKSMVPASRGKNAIKSVRDVSGKNYLAFNMNNSLLNSVDYLVDLAKTPEGRDKLRRDYITEKEGENPSGNVFVRMLIGMGENGQADQALDVAFDGGIISHKPGGRSKASRYTEKTKDDIVQFDLESFAANWDSRSPDGSMSYYTQPIAVFADGKRRYSISAPMATTESKKQDTINALLNDGLHAGGKTYADGKEIVDWLAKDGTVDLSKHNEAMKAWLEANPDLVENNPRLAKFAVVKGGMVEVTAEGMKMIEDYNFNYLSNSLMAQSLLVGKHEQAKSNSDYVKRAKGAIARHDGSLRGTSIEPLIIKDIYSKTGNEETDAGSFILPEDVKYIESRVGKRMGRGWKFVYYGSDKRGVGANNSAAGKADYYLKTSVQVLTKEFIGESKELQGIADKLKARRQHTAGGETLNMAFFESAAKKAPSIHGGGKGIAWDADFGKDSEAWTELDNNFMMGKKMIGIDGANMGIQLPMDHFYEEIGTPVQHHGSINNDLTEADKIAVDEIIVLEADIMDAALEEATKDVTSNGLSTPSGRLKSKSSIVKTMSKSAVTAITNGLAKFRHLSNPNISQNLPSVVKIYANQVKSLIKKSAKVITSGTIAIQGVSVGKGLNGFKTKDGADYIGDRYIVQADGTMIKRPQILPAEAIVPAGLAGKYMARVDQEFGTIGEAKAHADSMVTKNAGSSNIDNAGIKIKGLDRKFPSERAAKEFLYGRIAVMPGGKLVILGEEFTGSRVPSHGNQARVVMEIKGFQTKVLDENGNNRNNIIQVSSEVNNVLGSDHDGDVLHMNFRYDNPKNPREVKVNQYMDKVITHFQNVNKFKQLTADLGGFVAEVDARIAAVSDGKTERFDQNSPMGAAEFFEENVQGSSMIGSVAALNNGMAYLSRYNVGIGMTTGITIDGDTIHEFNNDLTKEGKEALSFQNAMLLNVVLDNANNQQATALGINPSTVASIAVLTRMGFKAKALDKIFTSDAAKAYAKFKGKKSIGSNSKWSSLSASEAAIIDMRLAPDAKGARLLLSKAKVGLRVTTDQIGSIEESINILALLESTEGISKDVYAINKLVGQHKSSGIGSNNSEVQLAMEESDKVLSGRSILRGEGLNELAKNPLIKSFKARSNKLASIYQSNDLTATPHAEATLDLIMSLTGNKNIARRDGDEQSKVIKEYYLGILTSHVPAFAKASKYIGMTNERVPKLAVSILHKKVVAQMEEVMRKGHNDFIAAVQLDVRETFKGVDQYSISPNREYINEYTTDQELDAISEGFANLSEELRSDILNLDFLLNEGGMHSSSIQPLMDSDTLVSISKSIDSVHQNLINENSGMTSAVEVADHLILSNPDIVTTGMYIHKNGSVDASNGSLSKALKAKRVVSSIQRDGIISNKPHFIKVIKNLPKGGKEVRMFKYKPIPTKLYKELRAKHKNDNSFLAALQLEGVYRDMGETTSPDGGKKESAALLNYKKMKRAAEANNSSPLINMKKLKFSNTKTGGESGFSNRAEAFNFDEYIQDKGHRAQSVEDSPKLKEALEELYNKYIANFNLAQEFDKTIIQTGKIKTLSKERLIDYARLFQRLDPSAVSSSHRAVVLEMAHRAADEQKASRNGKEWKDTGDISWLHSWFGSNNIPGHRPEIQRLVRLMEQEYDIFMAENVSFQKKLDNLTKDLIRERMPVVMGIEGTGEAFVQEKHWTGSLSEEKNQALYANMYSKKDGELVLKNRAEFLKSKPGKAERAFYEFFVETTNKYGKISAESLGERWKTGYIPHLQVGLKESIRQRGLFGLYDYMLQGTGDIDMVKVKGINPMTGKTQTKSFHDWKYLYYEAKGVKNKKWYKALTVKQFKATADLDVIRRRAEGLAKTGKHEDGSTISRSEQEVHGMMGTSMMSRFAKSRGVKSAMFGSADLGRALSQYVNTTMFVYGNENFKGFREMQPLLDGVIKLNETKGNTNAVRYLENVWKKGFYNLGESQTGLGRLTDGAIHKLVKLTRIRFLSLSLSGGLGNLVVGKYNEYRSKGGRQVIVGEKRYWTERKKSWALIKGNLNPESFAYDLIQGNDSNGINQLLMSPYIMSEHYIQGAGLVGQFTKEEWARIGADGSVPADLKERVDLYVENVVRQQGYGYSRVDQIGIATYSWGKAIMQFKKWMPTALAERFQQETIDRFGEMRTGSNMEAFKLGAELTRDVMAGDISMEKFMEKYRVLPEHKKEAIKTFYRGMSVVSGLTMLSMLFGESDDDEAIAFCKWADSSVDDIMFMTDPRRMKHMLEPASWQIVESGTTMIAGAATLDKDQFKGGLAGISWTASQVLNTSETAVKSIEN